MNFLVIGHSVVDKIIDDNKISIKPGGIFYSVVSLLSQMQSNDKLYLCSAIDNENEKLFNNVYDKIEKEFLSSIESMPQVELIMNKIGERNETYSGIPNNLILPKENLNRFDGILINMISGNDISLSQIENLRKNHSGLIYFDIHTFSRGVDEKFNRIFRRIIDFDKWAVCIDTLQANESELQTLSDKGNEEQIIDELLSYGIKQVIVTRAEKGASVFLRENNYTQKFHQNALQIVAVNNIGCGDVFGAVYFYNYIKNKIVLLALEQANLFAGITTTIHDTRDFLNLKKYADEWISKK